MYNPWLLDRGVCTIYGGVEHFYVTLPAKFLVHSYTVDAGAFVPDCLTIYTEKVKEVISPDTAIWAEPNWVYYHGKKLPIQGHPKLHIKDDIEEYVFWLTILNVSPLPDDWLNDYI